MPNRRKRRRGPWLHPRGLSGHALLRCARLRCASPGPPEGLLQRGGKLPRHRAPQLWRLRRCKDGLARRGSQRHEVAPGPRARGDPGLHQNAARWGRGVARTTAQVAVPSSRRCPRQVRGLPVRGAHEGVLRRVRRGSRSAARHEKRGGLLVQDVQETLLAQRDPPRQDPPALVQHELVPQRACAHDRSLRETILWWAPIPLGRWLLQVGPHPAAEAPLQGGRPDA
mmetsp:Transcript_80586/g.261091  ORF Transcript_80586/g.261091 Transcript_80586/m.261091 type:complete len:226 (-) Transcript_80586:3108-3785(-)